jgi:hypothetical protein
MIVRDKAGRSLLRRPTVHYQELRDRVADRSQHSAWAVWPDIEDTDWRGSWKLRSDAHPKPNKEEF